MHLEALSPSALSLFETTKEERKQFAREIVDAMREGQIDPLKVHMQLKSAESLIKNLLDKKENPETAELYSVSLLEAAEKYGKKFGLYNSEFQIKEAGTTYDYSQTNDDELFDLMEQEKALKEKIKARQEFLKKLPLSGIEVLRGDELVTLYPPAKSSTTTVAVTLK